MLRRRVRSLVIRACWIIEGRVLPGLYGRLGSTGVFSDCLVGGVYDMTITVTAIRLLSLQTSSTILRVA
jgi:hypothetical protein